jgi:hypothetical protein
MAESWLQLQGGAIWSFFRICNVLETGVELISGGLIRWERQKAGAPEMQLGNLLDAERRYPTPKLVKILHSAVLIFGSICHQHEIDLSYSRLAFGGLRDLVPKASSCSVFRHIDFRQLIK